MNQKGKLALITGASAGIGEACAEVFAEEGANLILLARRKNKLDEISKRIKQKYKVEILNIECDVRNRKNVEKSIKELPEKFKNIDILINNAGLARGMNKIQEGSFDDWDEMLDTNVKGLLNVSRFVLPGMVERKSGHVVNIGSLAGREVYPNGNVYCSTKYAVKAISKGMLIDLNGTGIRVTNLDPGLVETEFSEVRFRGDTKRAKSIYQGYIPLTSRDIAEVALFCVTRPKHVTIQDILITPTDQATAMILNKKVL
ncbi:MAG: SDR family NAD(P)-dependent oxidoreductase [Bacteroidetes bacterium]|nr:MAG: SDR family NAD(P)-dependent oxidoreductase [Bacteroidota bacterium]